MPASHILFWHFNTLKMGEQSTSELWIVDQVWTGQVEINGTLTRQVDPEDLATIKAEPGA